MMRPCSKEYNTERCRGGNKHSKRLTLNALRQTTRAWRTLPGSVAQKARLEAAKALWHAIKGEHRRAPGLIADVLSRMKPGKPAEVISTVRKEAIHEDD